MNKFTDSTEDRITKLAERITKLEETPSGAAFLKGKIEGLEKAIEAGGRWDKEKKGQDPEPKLTDQDIRELAKIVARQETEIGLGIGAQRELRECLEQARSQVKTQRETIESYQKRSDVDQEENLGLRKTLSKLRDEIKGLKDGTSVDFWKGMAEKHLQEVERLRKLLGR